MAPTISATILVLEANAAVLELIDQMLRESGHRVLSTNNGLEAVEVLRRVHVDVVIVGVPREGHRQALLAKLRSIRPGLPIVSICDPNDGMQKIDGTARLSSPFSLDDLGEAVAAGLNGRRGP